MHRKLLSLLTVLCLVLGTLPADVMAADAASELGYSTDEIAMYVSESAEITEDQNGLVVVAAPVEVSVKNARLTAGLLVAPGADGAKITLGENADVNAVIVLAASEIVVERTAAAVSVTVAAPESEVLVAGSVQVVTVAGEAAGATVTVADTAAVTVLEVAAPDVTVEVAGFVETVAMADTAAGAKLEITGTAVVNTVTNAAGDLSVSGPGAANIRIEEAAEPEDANTAGSDAGDLNEGPASSGDAGLPEQPEQPAQPEKPEQSAAPDLMAAPLADHSEQPRSELYNDGSYDIEVTPGTEDGNVLHVVIKAQDLVKYTAVEGAEEHAWVGIAIPVPTEEGITYSYYLLRLTSAASTKESVTPDSTWTNAGITYDLFYFNTDSLDGLTDSQYQLGAVAGEDALAEDVTPEFILELAFEVTHAAEEPPADGPADPEDTEDPTEPTPPEDNSPETPDDEPEETLPDDPDEPLPTPSEPEGPDEPLPAPSTPEGPDEPAPPSPEAPPDNPPDIP